MQIRIMWSGLYNNILLLNPATRSLLPSHRTTAIYVHPQKFKKSTHTIINETSNTRYKYNYRAEIYFYYIISVNLMIILVLTILIFLNKNSLRTHFIPRDRTITQLALINLILFGGQERKINHFLVNETKYLC